MICSVSAAAVIFISCSSSGSVCSYLAVSSFISDGITGITAQFLAVICNASLAEMIVITASVQSTQATPPQLDGRGERSEIQFIDLWFVSAHPSVRGVGGFNCRLTGAGIVWRCEAPIGEGEGKKGFSLCGCCIDSSSSWSG